MSNNTVHVLQTTSKNTSTCCSWQTAWTEKKTFQWRGSDLVCTVDLFDELVFRQIWGQRSQLTESQQSLLLCKVACFCVGLAVQGPVGLHMSTVTSLIYNMSEKLQCVNVYTGQGWTRVFFVVKKVSNDSFLPWKIIRTNYFLIKFTIQNSVNIFFYWITTGQMGKGNT